ncbi:tetratricopeptide repeat protein [bacterium]|nr:tetratricopeptide repeat protein [bacterium]NUN45102.1 tetratricopeptide repeat protein [bacterium]
MRACMNLFFFAMMITASLWAQLKVAVVPFYNGTMLSKNEWLGHGFCESLNTDLSEEKSVLIMDRPDVLAEIKMNGFKLLDMLDEQKALTVARSLEVDKIIIGSFDIPGGATPSIKVQARFIDVKSGKADTKNAYTAEGKYSMTNIYAMYGQIAARALVSFGKRAADETAITGKGSINVDAYEPYIKGILQYDESSTVEDYLASIALLQQAIKTDSSFAMAYAGMAKAYAKIGRIQDINFKADEKTESYKKALDAGLKAAKLDKNLAVAWTALALTYRELKERDQLIEAARKAVALKPSQYDAYDMLADAFSANFFPAHKNNDSSVFYRKKSVEYNNKFASGYRGLGRDYFDKGDYKNAEEAYQRAITLNPKHAGSRDLLGQVYTIQGQYEEAKQQFREAIKLDAKSAFAHTHLADVLAMEKNYAEAVTSYQSAIAINAKFALAYNGLAWIYIASKDKTLRNPAKAVENAQAAVQHSDSKNASYLYTLSEAHFSAGAHDAALETIGKALALDPHNNDYAEAQSRITKKEKNSDYVFTLRRGMMLMKQGRQDEGVVEFEEANKLSPQNVYILFTLAKYYDSKKEFKKAFEYYYRARSCDWDKKYSKSIQERMNELAPYGN